MKNIIIFIGITVIGISAAASQNSNNDPQVSINNYKHTNKALKAARTDMHQNLTGQEASLRSQRTNKIVKRDYVLAPSNSTTATNVQGAKTKANYKNQF
jgi:hypothetical protein